jgi:branched-chain amino acid transport system permease protein
VAQETKEPTQEGSEAEDGSTSGLVGLAGDGDDAGGPAEWLAEHRTAVLWVVAGVVAFAVLAALPINLGRAVVGGISLGSVYAMVALGLALVYTSTRVLNFAQGEFGTTAAFAASALVIGADFERGEVGLATMLVAALVAVLTGALLGVLTNLLVIRRLGSAFTALVATAALFTMMQTAQFLSFGFQRSFPRMQEGTAFALFGINISWHDLVIVFVLAGVAVLLALLFRTPLGVALLASAQEPYAASLYGVSPRIMSSLAWGTAGALAGIGGLLAGGIFRAIQPGFMTRDYLVPAFTAALLGGITSMPGAVIGALLLGFVATVGQQVVTAYGLDGMVPNAPVAASFVVLLIVLAVRPTGLLGKKG